MPPANRLALRSNVLSPPLNALAQLDFSPDFGPAPNIPGAFARATEQAIAGNVQGKMQQAQASDVSLLDAQRRGDAPGAVNAFMSNPFADLAGVGNIKALSGYARSPEMLKLISDLSRPLRDKKKTRAFVRSARDLGTEFEVLKNPTQREAERFAERTKLKHVRILKDHKNKDFYIWDSDVAIHDDVARLVGADSVQATRTSAAPSDIARSEFVLLP